jgi:hypothetical protein
VLERALALAQGQGSRLVHGETLRVLAECLITRGERDAAHNAIRMAVALFDELGATEQGAEAREWATTMWGGGAIQ